MKLTTAPLWNTEAVAGAAGGAAAAAAAATGNAAAAPAAGADPAATGAAAAAAAATGAAAAASAAYYPEGLAEPFRGASDRETIDKLAKHLGELPRPPEKPEAYQLKLDDKVVPYLAKDDPAVAVWRQAAHKLGLSEAQAAGAINELYLPLIEQGLIAPPLTEADFKTQLAELATIQGGSTDDRLRSGGQRFHAVRDDLQGLVTAKVIDDAGFKKLFDHMDRDVSVLPVIEALLKQIPVARGPKGGGGGQGDGRSEQERALAQMYPSMAKAS